MKQGVHMRKLWTVHKHTSAKCKRSVMGATARVQHRWHQWRCMISMFQKTQ
jgi:hypothetical protein